jgi:hypothetical protein
MATFWYHNAYTGTIASYRASDGLTDFNRGEYLAYGDYLTVGFVSKDDAEAWAKDWHACLTCKSVANGAIGAPCYRCKTPLVASKMEAEHAIS